MAKKKTEQQKRAAKFSKGDKVTWKTSQGKTSGTVVRVVKSETKVKGHKASASKKKPQVMVKSAKSGKRAVHKPGSLKKKS